MKKARFSNNGLQLGRESKWFFSLENKVHCDRIEEILDAVVVRRAASDRDGGHSLRWDCVVGFRQWLVASAAPPGGHCSPGWFIFLQWILWSINYLFFVGNRIKNNLWQLRQSFDLQTSRWKCEMRKTREKIGVFCTLIMKNNFVACHLSVSPGWSSKKEEKKRKSCAVLPCWIFLLFPFVEWLSLPGCPSRGFLYLGPGRNLRCRSYTCTDGTLLLRTCALISCTLVMIFFWWPISVTPSLWMSLEMGGGQDERVETSVWSEGEMRWDRDSLIPGLENDRVLAVVQCAKAWKRKQETEIRKHYGRMHVKRLLHVYYQGVADVCK